MMSRGGGGGGGGGQRKFQGPPSIRRKDIDDQDLLLFREMHKREKDRVVSLLQPVPDEFESNGVTTCVENFRYILSIYVFIIN